MRLRLKIRTVSNLIRILSPDFVEVAGLVLLPTEARHYQKNRKGFSDKSSLEAFQNHTHLIDLFEYQTALESNDQGDYLFNRSHPDFQELCYVGKTMAEMWFEKLKKQFPYYRFRVYYTEQDDPVVRFHRVRAEEPYWLYEKDWLEQIASGRLIVHDTGGE